jgi:hypothetical protein
MADGPSIDEASGFESAELLEDTGPAGTERRPQLFR